MKKVFKISTKAQEHIIFGSSKWYVFAEDIKEAISKIQNILSQKEKITQAEFLCNVDEDKDLEEYKKEREEYG